MNLSKPLRSVSRLLHIALSFCRSKLPRQRCLAFSEEVDADKSIGPIFVINLDRQADRWVDMIRELDCILDAGGSPLSKHVVRYSACDAQSDNAEYFTSEKVDPFYTLGDQLFVEPQPNAIPDTFDLERRIEMSRAEIAVACSHIGVWKKIAESNAAYSLVLEDDVWFERGFGQVLGNAWHEMQHPDGASPEFDILYVSYGEVRHGAPKELISENVFRPERGLWFLSGYVLSKRGAQALLNLLPCRGPIDLWINHKFGELKVRALRRSVVNQRSDLHSTNSYSILPTLSRIGILDSSDAALFHRLPVCSPVFAFGPPGSGLSSLAMGLSMLGYRCCSDLDSIPDCEFESLKAGRADRVFDAYVNIAALEPHINVLTQRYPNAKFIMIDEAISEGKNAAIEAALKEADVLHVNSKYPTSWRALCEHLKVAPPDAAYPNVGEIGLRRRTQKLAEMGPNAVAKQLRHDPSPWIAKSRAGWIGINASGSLEQELLVSSRACFEDDLDQIRSTRWMSRNDTFPGNLGLFRPANVASAPGGGISLGVMKEPLGVRNFSAAAISSNASFLFGRFEATLRATNVPGVVTGFFLHRNSPRQEIDVEISGNRPDHLLVNVFYNPGAEGAKFDYGYRGTPTLIKLGFDASKAFHQYAIEWDPCEIRWLVDRKLVHRRAMWDPTPIPHLPMVLHLNTWPTRSIELAGRLALNKLPASAVVRRIAIDAVEDFTG